MRLYRSTIAFLVLLALSISCNEKEKEVKPIENCRFVGKSFNLEQKSTNETSVVTYESNSRQDGQGRLTLVTVSQTELRKDSTGIFASITDEETYEFKYDAEGFLIELKRHNLQLQKGSANYEFSYATLRYRTGRVETTNVLTFVYKDGRVQSSKYVSNMVVQGDNLPAATFPGQGYTTVYEYDSKGNIQTATNSDAVTHFTNGVRTSYVSKDGKTVIKFNEQGRMISHTSPFDQRTYKYDQRGNQIFQEVYDKGVFIYSDEIKFDEHPNPDDMIPTRYKGIPEPVYVGAFSSENPNNWVERKFTHRNEAPFITSNVWTYHPNGLPATSTIITGMDVNRRTHITKFKYENCN